MDVARERDELRVRERGGELARAANGIARSSRRWTIRTGTWTEASSGRTSTA